MYVAELLIRGKSFFMSPSNGVLINTIRGLTGASARLSVVQNPIGAGDTVDGGKIGGNQLTIQGVFLDGNPEARLALYDAAVPLTKGVLILYNITDNYAQRYTEYRWTDVVIMQAPQIEQEHHGKFSLTFYQPCPCWYPWTQESVAIHTTNGSSGLIDIDYAGQIEAEFELMLTVRSGAVGVLDIWDDENTLELQLTNFQTGGLVQGDTIYLACRRSGIEIKINTIPDNSSLNVSSATLRCLHLGGQQFRIYANGGEVDGTLKWFTAYTGVVCNVG